MKIIRCDHCSVDLPLYDAQSVAQPIVTLTGYRCPRGDILLPEHLLEHEFCSPECFEKWMELPEEARR